MAQFKPHNIILFQRSVIEHNVLATAKIYKNITFDSLGELLGISPTKVGKNLFSLLGKFDKLIKF